MKLHSERDFIDLIKLYSECSFTDWNEYLTICAQDSNWQSLLKTNRRLQVGMDNLAKKKLNTPKMIGWFIRLTRSIEKTLRVMYHRACNDPIFLHQDMFQRSKDQIAMPSDVLKMLTYNKKQTDAEFYKRLKKESF